MAARFATRVYCQWRILHVDNSTLNVDLLSSILDEREIMDWERREVDKASEKGLFGILVLASYAI